MPAAEPSTDPIARRRIWRLGVGAHLALGLAAVGAVVLLGQFVTSNVSRTCRRGRALPAVALRTAVAPRRRHHREAGRVRPPGRGGLRAPMVVPAMRSARCSRSLRATISDLTRPSMPGSRAPLPISARHPTSQPDAAQTADRRAHQRPVAHSPAKSGQRQQWLSERHALLEANGRRINNAGGAGLAIDSTQVLARKSLIELSQAAAALRSVADLNETATRAEQDFSGGAHPQQRGTACAPRAAPGWRSCAMTSTSSVSLRHQVNQFDVSNARDRREFLNSGAR